MRWRGLAWTYHVDDSPDELHDAAARLGRRGEWAQDKGRTLHYDLPEELPLRAIELGGLHVLVNNAGISKDALIFHMEPDDWLNVMRVNFGGVFNCTKAVMPHFMGQREGVILNISSVMGERGWLGESNYSASKGAVNAFTRCCAMELARFGVRVNAVLPGFVPTELVEGLVSKDGGKGILKQLPMKSFGEVGDVANLVVFLASDDAKYMTGSLVTVDGGAAAMLGTGAPL